MALSRHFKICILVFRRKSKLEFLKAIVSYILFFAINYLVKFSELCRKFGPSSHIPSAEETFELKLLNNVFHQEKKASSTTVLEGYF